MHQALRPRHFLLLRTHHFLFRLADLLILNLCAVEVLDREILVRRGRFLLAVDDHLSWVDAVQSYPIRNRPLLLRLRRMPDLGLLGNLNLLKFDVVARDVGTPVLGAHDLVSVEVHHLFVNIVAWTLLLRTWITDRFEGEIFLGIVYCYGGHDDFGVVAVIDRRHPDRSLRW